jgi:uncharacterized protein YjiS (DUF1127 family)
MEFDKYYELKDYEEKKKFLEEHEVDDDSELYEIRKEIFNNRYVRKSAHETVSDMFIRTFMMLLVLNDSRMSLKKMKEEYTKLLKDIGIDPNTIGERSNKDVYSDLLYQEIRNAALFYISTSKSDQYRKRFMGFISSSDKTKHDQMRKDCWKISYGVAKKAFMEAEADILIRAVSDEYEAEFDGEKLRAN